MAYGKLIPSILAASLLAAGVPAVAKDKAERGEAELAEMLEGRTAGEPKRCLSDFERRNMRVIDGTAFVFESGDTIYVNRPAGARMLDWNDVPVFKIWGGQLCEKDTVELRDSASLIPGPVLFMGEFVSYRRTG
jgi:hypothetical protein